MSDTILITGGSGFIRPSLALDFRRRWRIYPAATLSALRYETREARFQLLDDQPVPSIGSQAIGDAEP